MNKKQSVIYFVIVEEIISKFYELSDETDNYIDCFKIDFLSYLGLDMKTYLESLIDANIIEEIDNIEPLTIQDCVISAYQFIAVLVSFLGDEKLNNAFDLIKSSIVEDKDKYFIEIDLLGIFADLVKYETTYTRFITITYLFYGLFIDADEYSNLNYHNKFFTYEEISKVEFILEDIFYFRSLNLLTREELLFFLSHFYYTFYALSDDDEIKDELDTIYECANAFEIKMSDVFEYLNKALDKEDINYNRIIESFLLLEESDVDS